MFNFALIGAAGYIAPRHMKAIKDTGNRLIAAADPHDAVGVLDRFSFDTAYFREIERFDRHLCKLRRGSDEGRVHFVSICSPNFLHDAHVRLALRAGADAICEKPLVIEPWNLDPLEDLEKETGRRVFTVLQLHVQPALVKLREEIKKQTAARHDVVLTYVTARGPWYRYSWKGSHDCSGGIATNIGVHFFDLVMWLFGGVRRNEVHLHERERMSGFLDLERADVRWFLSIDSKDLPFAARPGDKTTFRSITVDEKEVEFTDGFTDLHTKVYEEILGGRGEGIPAARPSIELVHAINTAPVTERPDHPHPKLGAG